MKSLFGGSKSFFDIERKKVEKLLKVPLLELVLEYLPHLQGDEQQEDDLWELISIKLNDYQFNSAVQGRNEDLQVDEMPTLNGSFVKELFHKIMKTFENEVQGFNWNNRIYRTNILMSTDNRHQGSMYFAFNLPVKEAYSEKDDLLCCELFYMKGLHVETRAQLARERFLATQRNPPSREKKPTGLELTNVKAELEAYRLETCLEELQKRKQRIEQLNTENKRLMELNQTLLDELNQLRKV